MAKRVKMDTSNRAKQFAPFAALKGFEEAIRGKETVYIPKAELTQESVEEINEKLCLMHVKDMVSIVFYNLEAYQKVTGMVSEIDAKNQYIRVVERKIPFKHIVRIETE